MRNGLLGLDQALGNDLAHAVVRNEFVRTFLEQLEDGLVRLTLGKCRSRSASRCCSSSRSSLCTTRGNSLFNVGLDDAAMWSRTGDIAEIEASFMARRRASGEAKMRSPDLATGAGVDGAAA